MEEKHIWRIFFGLLVLASFVTALTIDAETRANVNKKMTEGAALLVTKPDALAEKTTQYMINEAQLEPYNECLAKCAVLLKNGE